MSYENFQKAMRDQTAFKLDRRGMKNEHRYCTDKARTRSRVVQWFWYRHRTTNGYFLGYRQTYTRDGRLKIDQWTAMRTKKKLAALQQKRFNDLLDKPGTVKLRWNTPNTVALPPAKPKLDETTRNRQKWNRLLARAAQTEQRICFGIAWFKTEKEADEFSALNEKIGRRYNGGFYHGTLCARDKSWDKKRPPLYAVTY